MVRLNLLQHLFVDLGRLREISLDYRKYVARTDLERIDLEVQVLVLNQTVNLVRKYVLQIRLSRSAARIGRHHA